MKTVGIITGVLTSILGAYALCVPMRTFLGIGWALGILFLINGIEMVMLGLAAKKKDIGKCLLGILVGIVGGILLFSGIQRILTDVMVAYLIGISIIVYGIYAILAGTKTYKVSKGKGILSIAGGVIAVIAGIISVSHPMLTMVAVGYIVAASLLVQGINMIIAVFNIGKEK